MWYLRSIGNRGTHCKAAWTRMKTLTIKERFSRPRTNEKQETYGVLMSFSDIAGLNRTPLGFDKAHSCIMPGLLGEPTAVVRECVRLEPGQRRKQP